MAKYFDELQRAMEFLGEQPDTVFLGQAVEYAGTAMSNTLKNVDNRKLIEMPVCEEMQMGITNGFAINGKVPISIFPRWNFLLCAMNQLINHTDKMTEFSHGEFNPHAIIRTSVGSQRPLHPQAQHIGDFTHGFWDMVENIEVIHLHEPDQIFDAYHKAYTRKDGKSTVLVEFGDFYNEK